MSFLQSKMNTLLNKMKMNCEHSTSLHSKSMDTELNLGESLRLKLHNFMCKVCAVYANQVDFISENAKKKAPNVDAKNEEVKMSCDAKDRLKEALKSKLKS